MKGYIICLFFVFIFTILANRYRDNRKIYIMFALFASITLSIICGYRDFSIVAARDVNMYVTPLLVNYDNFNIVNFVKTFNHLEAGFVIFCHVILNIFKDGHMLLFFLQFICSMCIYEYAYLKKDKCSIPIIIMIYVLFWYIMFFTLMRQGVALCLILLGAEYLSRKNFFRTFLLTLLAFSFHSSAIIAIPMYIYSYWFIGNSRLSNKEKNQINFLVILFAIIVFVFYQEVIYFFTYVLGILPQKLYLYTVDSRFYLSTGSLKTIELVLTLISFLVSILYIKLKKNKSDNDTTVYMFYLFIGLITLIISTKVSVLNRISYYFIMPSMFYFYSVFKDLFKKDRLNQFVSCFAVFLLFLSIWIYKYPMVKEWESYPYRSDVINILN